jgi:hypothetical protein
MSTTTLKTSDRGTTGVCDHCCSGRNPSGRDRRVSLAQRQNRPCGWCHFTLENGTDQTVTDRVFRASICSYFCYTYCPVALRVDRGDEACHYYAVHRIGPGPNDYSMDHSSILYLMGPDGRFLAPLRTDARGAEIASELSKLMS